MVPQMVKARPPLSRRRDKPKSARRRCPRADHFYSVISLFLKQPDNQICLNNCDIEAIRCQCRSGVHVMFSRRFSWTRLGATHRCQSAEYSPSRDRLQHGMFLYIFWEFGPSPANVLTVTLTSRWMMPKSCRNPLKKT